MDRRRFDRCATRGPHDRPFERTIADRQGLYPALERQPFMRGETPASRRRGAHSSSGHASNAAWPASRHIVRTRGACVPISAEKIRPSFSLRERTIWEFRSLRALRRMDIRAGRRIGWTSSAAREPSSLTGRTCVCPAWLRSSAVSISMKPIRVLTPRRSITSWSGLPTEGRSRPDRKTICKRSGLSRIATGFRDGKHRDPEPLPTRGKPMRLDTKASGVFPIAPTPFNADGRIDEGSIDRLAEFYRAIGATGTTVLGIMGEAPKLELEEIDRHRRAFRAGLGQAPGRGRRFGSGIRCDAPARTRNPWSAARPAS